MIERQRIRDQVGMKDWLNKEDAAGALKLLTEQVHPEGSKACRRPVMQLAKGPAVCHLPAPACSSEDSLRDLRAEALADRLYSRPLSGGESGSLQLSCPAVSWQPSPRAVLLTPECTGPASTGMKSCSVAAVTRRPAAKFVPLQLLTPHQSGTNNLPATSALVASPRAATTRP